MQTTKFFVNREDAERRIKVSVAVLASMLNYAAKIDVENLKTGNTFGYGNEYLFSQLNGFLECFLELVKISKETQSNAKSPQHRDFAGQLALFINEINRVNLLYFGAEDLEKLIAFMNAFRNIVDINVIHKKIFSELHKSTTMTYTEAVQSVITNTRLYILMKEEKMARDFQLCLDTPVPKMFKSTSKDDLFGIKQSIDENANYFAIINTFLVENVANTKTPMETIEKKKRFGVQLMNQAQNVNGVLKRWIESFNTAILGNN